MQPARKLGEWIAALTEILETGGLFLLELVDQIDQVEEASPGTPACPGGQTGTSRAALRRTRGGHSATRGSLLFATGINLNQRLRRGHDWTRKGRRDWKRFDSLPFTDGKTARIPVPSAMAGANSVGFG